MAPNRKAQSHSVTNSAEEVAGVVDAGGFEVSIYSPRDDKKISKTFRTESEAKPWRAEA
jgi:hypothetical protein